MATTSNISLEKEQMIAANLNLYLFQNVWNETKRALRNNVLPQMLNARSMNGTLTIYGEATQLPNLTDPFFVYAVSRSSTPGLQWPKNLEHVWISTDELINKYNILLDVYHIHGKMMHKKDVHVYKLPNAQGFLIAVNKKMSSKVIPVTEMPNLRLTVYFDMDIENDIVVKSYTVPAQDNNYTQRALIWNQYQSFLTVAPGTMPPAVLMFINGIETKPVDVSSIPLNAAVDLHADYNVAMEMEVDLTSEKLNAGFFSDLDKVYKQIVHVPMAKNPKQYIMTHNAMEIYVRKKQPEADGTYQGLYLHRCADRSVTQITHQDIGIPMYILDAYRDYFGTSEITLRVYWRKHDSPNYLIRDKNYIDLMYYNAHSDQEIIGYLSGMHQWSEILSFWKASHLEQSAYVAMFFDVPDVITPENMTYYIEALGYYNVMCLLCKHVYRTIITDWYHGGYTFQKPLVYQGSPVSAVVYADGVKLNNSLVTIRNDDDYYVTINVPDTLPLGTKLAVEMFLSGLKNIYTIKPEFGSTTITLPATEYTIVEEMPSTVTIKKYDQEAKTGYSEFTKTPGNVVKKTLADGSYQLTFGPATFGRRFYIVPKPRVHYWSSEIDTATMNIHEKMENKDPLFFPLIAKVIREGVNNETGYTNMTMPLWDSSSMLIYINGRYLIRDVDYTIQTVKNYEGYMCMQILVIQNLSYLDKDNNILEVYSTSASIENREYGYCAERKNLGLISSGSSTGTTDAPIEITGTIRDNRTFIYYPETTIAHVNGYYSNVLAKGNSLGMDPDWLRPWETGNPLEVRTSVPYFISDYLKKYHVNDDLERIELLNKYFYNRDLRMPDKIIITSSHLLYSVYTATVLRDVLMEKNLELSYDPDNERMINQLQAYDYLKDIDLITNKLVDLTYVDGYPHYSQLIAPDVEMYRLLQALMRATMPEDNVSNKQDVDLTHP